MRRWTVLLAFVGPLAWAQPFTMFRVYADGQPSGKAYLKNLPTEDGGRRTILSLFLGSGAQVVRLRSETVVDREGLPISKSQEVESGKSVEHRTATFGAGFASLVVERSGQLAEPQKVPVDPSLPVKDPSVFWFIRDHPAVGASVSFYSFSIDTAQWNLNEVRYAGETKVTIEGKEVDAYRVITSRLGDESEALIGHDGLLLKLSSGSMSIIRTWEAAPVPPKRPPESGPQ